MFRLISINILRINCASSWFYLQDYTEIQVNKTHKFVVSLEGLRETMKKFYHDRRYIGRDLKPGSVQYD